MKKFSFESTFISKKNKARLGIIHTPHGDIQTPAFVPVGTQATVKSLTPEEIKIVGTQLFFVNTYHMAMRPGIDVVDHFGGLHTMMKWNGPIITDSGGFQVFSLARRSPAENSEGGSVLPQEHISILSEVEPSLVKMTEEGVTFRSHWDGSYHEFNPEISMQYQWKLGSDIHIAFDDCTAYPVSHDDAEKSMERTHRWAVRSLEEHKRLSILCHPDVYRDPSLPLDEKVKSSIDQTIDPGLRRDDKRGNHPYQALYGSIQGSVFEDLRKKSANFISSLDTDGIAVGGVSVGESKDEMKHVLDWVMPILPEDKPRHLLGVGEIDDIFMLIEQGIDTFDCVLPTRLARGGYMFSRDMKGQSAKYILNINKSIYQRDTTPVDNSCTCYTCTNFHRGYIHHLFKVKELLAYRLATIHNLTFIHTLVSRIRQSISQGDFETVKSAYLSE